MKLYALCDEEMLISKNISIDDFLNLAKKYGAEIIQYRNKKDSMAYIKKRLIYIRKNYDGFLIVNDKYELAEFCDGVHLGQEDLVKIDKDKFKSIEILRKVLGKEKIIGISTHNEKEILEANGMNLNYIGLGAFRTTSTKKDVSSILGDQADKLAKLSLHPVAIIGGVKLEDRFHHITYHVIGSGLV